MDGRKEGEAGGKYHQKAFYSRVKRGRYSFDLKYYLYSHVNVTEGQGAWRGFRSELGELAGALSPAAPGCAPVSSALTVVLTS